MMPVKIAAPPRAMAVLDVEVKGPERPRLEVPRMRYHEGIECPPECDHEPA